MGLAPHHAQSYETKKNILGAFWSTTKKLSPTKFPTECRGFSIAPVDSSTVVKEEKLTISKFPTVR